jgi:hypothetical protein
MAKRTYFSGFEINGIQYEVQCFPIKNNSRCVVLSKEFGMLIFERKSVELLYANSLIFPDYLDKLKTAIKLWLIHPKFK